VGAQGGGKRIKTNDVKTFEKKREAKRLTMRGLCNSLASRRDIERERERERSRELGRSVCLHTESFGLARDNSFSCSAGTASSFQNSISSTTGVGEKSRICTERRCG